MATPNGWTPRSGVEYLQWMAQQQRIQMRHRHTSLPPLYGELVDASDARDNVPPTDLIETGLVPEDSFADPAVDPAPGFEPDILDEIEYSAPDTSTLITPVPAPPVLFVHLGTVTLSYGGATATGDQMPAWAYPIQVHRSLEQDFVPTDDNRVGVLLQPTGMVMPPQDYGVTWWYALTAVGAEGGWSEPSPSVSAVTSPLVEGDIAAEVIDDIVAEANAYTDTVLASASGKNKIYYSTASPGSTPNTAGDLWFRFDAGTNQIYEQWVGTGGTSWTQTTLRNEVIATLDAGKITTGFLNAARIQTASLSGDKIIAGTIGVTKLAVGDTSNHVDINESSAPSVLDTGGGSTHTIEVIGTTRWSKRSANTSTDFHFRDPKGPVPFAAGDRLRVRLNALSDVATTAGVYLHVYSDSAFLRSQQIGSSISITTVDTAFAVEADITSTTLEGATRFVIGLSSLTANRNVRVRSVRAHLMNAGELLVDGSIKTQHMLANAVTADKIAAGSVTAEKIALGVLRSNLVPDPTFEDSYTIPTSQSDSAKWQRLTGTVTREENNTSLSGAKSLHLTAAAAGEASVLSGSFPVVAGQTYKVIVNALSLTAQANLNITLYSGATPNGVSAANTPPALVGVGEYTTIPAPLRTVPVQASDFQSYAAEFTADLTEYIAIRVANSAPAATSTLVVDDISCVQEGIGGATEITVAGIRLFGDDGEEVGAFVNNRPNYFTVTRDQITVAAIDEMGHSVFSETEIVGRADAGAPVLNEFGDAYGFSVGGNDYADRMTSLPQGVLVQMNSHSIGNVAINKIRSEYGIYELSWFHGAGRHYKVLFTGGSISSNEGNVRAYARVRFTTDGSKPTISSPVLRTHFFDLPATAGKVVTIPPLFVRGNFGVSNATVRCLLTLTITDASANGYLDLTTLYGTGTPTPMEGTVEDLGLDAKDTWLVNDGGGTLFTGGSNSTGGGSSTTEKKTYVSTWYATDSESYTSAHVAETWTTDMQQGYYSSSNGNQYSVAVFTGTAAKGETSKTIGQALTGATLDKAEVYLYFKHWNNNSGGTAIIRGTSRTSPTSGHSAADPTTSPNWPRSWGRWVNVTSNWSSTYRGLVLGPGSSTNAIYYGRAASHVDTSTYRPKLRLTYRR